MKAKRLPQDYTKDDLFQLMLKHHGECTKAKTAFYNLRVKHESLLKKMKKLEANNER